MKYKEELIMNAEYNRKGSKISDEQIREWLETEKDYEEKVNELIIKRLNRKESKITNFRMNCKEKRKN